MVDTEDVASLFLKDSIPLRCFIFFNPLLYTHTKHTMTLTILETMSANSQAKQLI